MALKHNVAANYLGQGWSAAIQLAFIPIYIKYLGVEGYGLIGVFGIMQSCAALLDVGMTPTLSREMARFTAGAHTPQSIRDMMRSVEIICFSIAAMIGVVGWMGSAYIAQYWIKAEMLSGETVSNAIIIMILVVALRFCEGIYRGALFGLQKQVWYNSANALLSTLRAGGAALLLALLSPTVEVFFYWQAVISLGSVMIFAVYVYRNLPPAPIPGRFSIKALREIWKFSIGMMGITLTAILLTQLDKILLLRLLPLESFGYYALASSVAGALVVMVGPVSQAISPRMVELATQDDRSRLIAVYHKGTQLVTVLTAPAALLLCFFGKGIIYLWSGDSNLAERTAPILMLLAAGTYLHSLLYVPYQLQLAHGWTSLTLKANVVASCFLVPLLFWVAPRYGALGVASLWVLLYTGHMLISIQVMHTRLIPKEKTRWYWNDIAVPTAASLAVMLVAHFLRPSGYSSRLDWLAFLLGTGVSAVVVSAVFADTVRTEIKRILARSDV
jgi:O-antigen/teichoic acid export membrane protein